MKVAKTTVEEIFSLLHLLNELELLHKELQRVDFDAVDWDEFEVLSTMGLVSDRGLDLGRDREPEYFVEDLVRRLSGIHFQRVLLNAEVLLNHCADPDQDTLEYSPDLAKGLYLLREWTDAEPGRRKDFPVLKVKHSNLDRIGDSKHKSQCPKCSEGLLLMRRDEAAPHGLQTEDWCTFCAQRYEYTDVKEGQLVVEQF